MTDVAFDNSLDSCSSDHGFDPPASIKPLSIWQDETICAYVRKLWGDHSASEICVVLGAELGVHVGRNAVVGWLHRQKLTAEHKTKLHPLTSGLIAPRRAARPKRDRKPAAARPKQISGEPLMMRCAEVDPLHISFEQLTFSSCRYPFGDNPFTFCGHSALKGAPYCGPHLALTHKATGAAA